MDGWMDRWMDRMGLLIHVRTMIIKTVQSNDVRRFILRIRI